MSKTTSGTTRGRSPGPAADRQESVLSELSVDSPLSAATMPPGTTAQTASAVRTSKRRKRSELSPSSKQTHSIIEKERREAMNEKFSELAANIPELVEAIASGKRPTKGEIVKASIARHQEQDRRLRELLAEVQMLRVKAAVGEDNGSVASFASLESPGVNEAIMAYQIQPSHPIGAITSGTGSNLWVGQLLNKPTPDALSLHETHPLPLLSELGPPQPVSPFKSNSLMNPTWPSLSTLPSPLDPATLSISFPSSIPPQKLFESGALDQLSRRSSAGGSGFSSPTFTSTDSETSFTSAGGTESWNAWEPFSMVPMTPAMTLEQTPLSSLVGLPTTTTTTATMMPEISASLAAKKAARRGRKSGKEEPTLRACGSVATSLSITG